MAKQRHETILQCAQTAAVVVDFQERMVNAMPQHGELTQTVSRLLQGLTILQVPLLATEQYPKGLGATVAPVKELLPPDKIFEKLTFSCCGITPFTHALQATGRRQVVLAGIEAHVCVLQTALDLTADGFQIHVPLDAAASRSERNRDNAFERMRQAGIIVTNTESVLFELMTKAGTEAFKQVRQLIV